MVEQGDEGISIKELDQVPMICHRQASGAQTAIEREFQRHGIKINSSMVVENNEVVKRMVEAGLASQSYQAGDPGTGMRGSLVNVPIRDAKS